MSKKIEIKVRGYHLDGFQHVNNARYLEFLEEARWAFFENTLNLDRLSADGYNFAVVNININYRQEAVLNDILSIKTNLGALGSRSGTLHQVVTRKHTEDLIADAVITFVLIDTAHHKAAELKGELLERMKTALGI